MAVDNKQGNLEKIFNEYFEKTGFNDDKVDEYFEMFTKYLRYDNVKETILNVIKNSEEYRKKTLDDLSKTSFSEREKEKLFSTIMKHNYLADIDEIIICANNALSDEHEALVYKINKSPSEKAKNTLRDKNNRVKREAYKLKDKHEEMRAITIKTKKESDKAKEKIQKNIKKNEKRR